MVDHNIIVINLKERTDRKEYVEKQLRALDIHYTLYEAINGNEINIDSLDSKIMSDRGKICIDGKIPKRWGLTLTKGAVGCALSHYNIWKALTDEKKIIIFEDDIILCENFKEKFKDVYKDVPEDWELIYLGSHIKRKKLEEEHKPFFKPRGQVNGTGSYIINKRGAEKLINLCFPLQEHQIDTVMYSKFKFLKVYHINPPLVEYRKFSSDVQ